MTKPSSSDIEKLLNELVFPFYELERDMLVPVKKRRNENDAEHSWSLAFIACSLAHELDKTLDIGKVCQFAMVHDLVEIFAGDTSVWADEKLHANKAERELEAIETIKRKYTEFPWIASIVQEYERKDSNEARYVYAMDKYIGLAIRHMDKGQFYREHKITKAQFDKMLKVHRTKAQAHAGVAKIYEQIRAAIDAHPEYFYQE